MTNNDKTSSRATVAEMLRADTPEAERLRLYVADMLKQLARSGVCHLELGTPLPLPSDLIEILQARPKPNVSISPNWTDTEPFAVSTASSVHGSNKGLAAFAAIITNAEGVEKEVSCWYASASSQEAEVRALIMALEAMPKGSSGTITSTNVTSVRTFNEYMPKWKNSGWRNSAGQEPSATPLWRWVDVLAGERTIAMVHVPKGEAASSSRRALLLAHLALERAIAVEDSAT